MVGGLRSSDALFRREGYTGTESHFGVGGPWDGADLDGAVWQWQTLDRQADAQNAGNAYATSIETADGGEWTRPWSPKQIAALIKLGAWWCRQPGHRPRLVEDIAEAGVGDHAQFRAWAPDGRACPGQTRIRQLKEIIIPGVAGALAAPKPSPPIIVLPASNKPAASIGPDLLRLRSPYERGADVRAVQRALGFTGRALDGVFGPNTKTAVVAFQRRKRLTADGVVGPKTAKALGLGWRGTVSA